MERNIAESLMRDLLEIDSKLGDICRTIETIEAIDLKREMRTGVATVISEVYFWLMRPVIAAHPDLDPDTDRLSSQE